MHSKSFVSSSFLFPAPVVCSFPEEGSQPFSALAVKTKQYFITGLNCQSLMGIKGHEYSRFLTGVIIQISGFAYGIFFVEDAGEAYLHLFISTLHNEGRLS